MQSFYLGIDASKGYADFVLRDEAKRTVERDFQLDDTFDGHSKLYQILEAFCAARSGARIFAAVESTGGYENNWIHALRRFQATLPLEVARLNPAHVHENAKAAGRRLTTDALSAENVADFLIAHPEQVDYQQEDDLAGLRRQWSFIEQLIKQRSALVNQLEKAIYSAHPELIAYLSSGMPAWVLKLLKRYPTAKRLARARAKTVSTIPYVTRERAEELVRAATRSVASAGDVATETAVRETARQVLHLTELVKAQKEAMSRHMELPEEVEILKSYHGVGEYAAVGLLLEIQAAERFASAKKMASFFGVHPTFKKSGDGIGAMRMSKQGSSRMRSLLFMITLRAVQDNPVIAPLYERLVKEGMARMAAIGVCMHKTLRILYGMLKHRRPFDPDVDRTNRERARPERRNVHTDRARRYQSFDASAPVSRRAQKKRRQQKRSQSVVHAECGMSTSTAVSQNEREDTTKSFSKEHPQPA
jgi:transposase